MIEDWRTHCSNGTERERESERVITFLNQLEWNEGKEMNVGNQ